MKEGWLAKKLILIMGKGGVGKTTVANAAARVLARQGKRVLLVHILQLTEDKPQQTVLVEPNLEEVTLNPSDCFKEYIMLKLKLRPLYTAFLGNRVTQYLERAAPGVREMVLLGKIWFERSNYDHIVVDMPSTGYALTMVHTPFNFAALFPGGPIYTDSQRMVETLSDPNETALVAISLPEEMPIQESLELVDNLGTLMQKNAAWLVLNKLIHIPEDARSLHEKRWASLSAKEFTSPLWQGLHYLVTRENNEKGQLQVLRNNQQRFSSEYLKVNEVAEIDDNRRIEAIAKQLATSQRSPRG